ncbi:MAG: ABC-type branched-chain amino acid transport system periplasmic component-like protein [Acidimicrobiales bacterium]|nr:ABC-type branched-chain amino acid transport system periplasmic component-like protein [Acidimicrobiales bacterium]
MRRWLAIVGVLAVLAAGCARGSDGEGAGAASNKATTTTAAAAGVGDFGTLKKVCGPGEASGATARGVTDTEIHLGTMADPTNTVLPGIGQESFDVGDAFVEWCNAAGGILGRKLVLAKRDAKLFEVGARMIEACQTDFMLVGSANPLDAAGLEPRLGCDLAQIPAYVVSAQAAVAEQQVVIDSSIKQVGTGAWQALAKKFPEAFQAISLVTVDGAGLDSYAERQRDALTTLGSKVVDFQKAPVTGVDNWRPYAQNALGHGAKAVITLSPDISPFVRSFGDVGWKPDVLPLGVQNYNAGTIALAKEGVLPTTYVTTTYWPFEAAAKNPAVGQAIELIKSTSKLTPGFAHLQALNAWLLWASSAKACGSQLTGACVIEKAGSWKGWTGGGIIAPVDTQVGGGVISQCFVLLKATPTGFVLVPEITKPNNKIFNCDPANVVEVTDTHTGG